MQHLCVCARSVMSESVTPPGSSVLEIIQAGVLEWVAISSSGGLPDPEIEPASLASPALADGFFTTMPPRKPHCALRTHVLDAFVLLSSIWF